MIDKKMNVNAVNARRALVACVGGGMLLTAWAAHAQSSAPSNEPTPPGTPWTVTGHAEVVSEYRFRGIDQTWGRPALQAGMDVSAASGWYAGTWLSNVSGHSYPGGSLEWDLYGGYNGKLTEDLGYTVGTYGYLYPGANTKHATCPSAAYATPCGVPSQGFDTLEFNAGLSWKWLSYKLSWSATDYFGANHRTGYDGDTRGTLYHDLGLSWPLRDDLTLTAHIGRTQLRANYGAVNPSYTDYRVGLAKTWDGGWNASLAWVKATNDRFYRPPTGGLSSANGDTRDLNRGQWVLQLGRTF